MQMLSIPPHAHDIHQKPEHAIGCGKNFVTEKFRGFNGCVSELTHADVQEWVRQGVKKYTASSWRENVHRLIQCLRVLSSPVDRDVTVTLHAKGAKGKRPAVLVLKGTDGNYCYKRLS